MKNLVESILVGEKKYIREDLIENKGPLGKEVIIRTYSAGVHIGVLDGEWIDANKPIKLLNARRIYSWKGANTLNEIALNGLDRKNSRISKSVTEIYLVPVEVLPIAEGVDLSECWK